MTNTLLKEDERLDHLLAEDLRIIQSPSVFSFSLDAVLLAHFAAIPRRTSGRIIDICSGNGVIPLMLSQRTGASITAVELQPRLADMAKRSVTYNELDEQISIVEGDVKGIHRIIGQSYFDALTCNPPYFKVHPSSEQNSKEPYAIARHEIALTLEEAIQSSTILLKQGGRASFVHRPERFIDLVTLMRQHRLEPKRVQFVYSKREKDATVVLVEGIKDGQVGMRLLPPFYIYEEDNQTYTPQMRKMLYGK